MFVFSWGFKPETEAVLVSEPEQAVSESIKEAIMYCVSAFLMLSAFFFNTPSEILSGLLRILVSPAVLISDFIAIGNAGATLMNSGLVLLVGLVVLKLIKVGLSGAVLAALFTLVGFSFFGKNLYNTWAVPLGVLVYAKLQKEPFSKYVVPAFFGTALGPLTSFVTFGLGLSPWIGVPLGNIAGMAAGFFLPTLAAHFLKFHMGFNLYNVGFTAGIIGMFFMGVFRAFGVESISAMIVSEGYTLSMSILIVVLCGVLGVAGFILNNRTLKGYKNLCRQSGRLVSDFVSTSGFGLALVNMAIIGLIALCYVILIGGEINGPIIGGIFTVIGFGALGKHPVNTIPILAGVYLAATLKVFDPNSTLPMLAALFGTTLAPIAGHYGWVYGIIAGFLHMSVVMNVGYLNGGVNLYNNGFSGGFIAAVLAPLLDSIKLRIEMSRAQKQKT